MRIYVTFSWVFYCPINHVIVPIIRFISTGSSNNLSALTNFYNAITCQNIVGCG